MQAADEHPAWGARKLKASLERKGHSLPAASTAHVIPQRHGARRPEAREHAQPEYGQHIQGRKADANGRICFQNQNLKVGKVFIRE